MEVQKMEIPKNLHNPEIRFVLLGQWNKWKNSNQTNLYYGVD
jgi:hypothetical protein